MNSNETKYDAVVITQSLGFCTVNVVYQMTRSNYGDWAESQIVVVGQERRVAKRAQACPNEKRSISPLERCVFGAVGEAHRGTDAPVACHREFGTAAWEVLEALEAVGIAPERIMLARPSSSRDGGEDLVRRILIDNPARFLGFTPPEGG
jgi:hypothetical protein